jgi:hypothetical protein
MAILDRPIARRIRRRVVAERKQKPGWQVRSSVAEAVKEAVAAGAAESQNSFVEEALLRRLAELRRERLYAAYEAAAADPAFVADMESVTRAFEPAVADGLQG